MRLIRTLLLLLPLGVAGCFPQRAVAPNPRPAHLATLIPARPEQVGMDRRLGVRLDSIAHAAIRDSAAPGMSIAVGRHGRLVYLRGHGRQDWTDASPRVDPNTLYDLASLTKVIGTTTAAMALEDAGQLDLSRTVSSYLPRFNAPDKQAITVEMLLTHRGGLEAGAPLHRDFRGMDQYLEQINLRPARYQPGARMIYSDWDLVLLQAVIERVTGRPLDAFLRERVWTPLAMTSTLFNPPAELLPRIAPTERIAGRGNARGLIHGSVHDGNAYALGGVAGHAGLFSTARDLAVFAQMVLNAGEYNGVRIVRPQTAARWTTNQGPGSSRAIGWDSPGERSSAGRYFGPRSFGHTGYTGTSIWLDPERGLFVVILTNRVNPTAANQRHVPLRRAVADAVQQAVLDAPLVDWEVRR